jgi:hypothetical protein
MKWSAMSTQGLKEEVDARTSYITPGMPQLKESAKQLSFYEFWPTWLVYIPVAIQWLLLAIRYRSLTLPLLANPKLPLSGMVGVGKSELLSQAHGECEQAILSWFVHPKSNDSAAFQAAQIEAQFARINTQYPVVAKPDIGCRGVGVKLVHNNEQLQAVIQHYPTTANIMIQALSQYEPEAGVFYVKDPLAAKGRIISLALKYTPFVVGDGRSTLQQLIEKDDRAAQLTHLYQKRHHERWHSVIEKDQPFKLVFSASHSKGAIFSDANHLITQELQQSLNNIMHGLPDFHYGRLDVKFKDIEHLKRGESIEIIEINSASSESLHIWDSNTPFPEAMRALLFQYRLLFQFGHTMRSQGYRPPGLLKLLKHWRKERVLSRSYPLTD